MEMSGTARPPWTACWPENGSLSAGQKPGDSGSLSPPPLPTQPISWTRLAEASEIRVVPPTPVTYMPEAGQLVPGNELGTPVAATNAHPSPLSPDEANRVWPCMAPSVSTLSVLTIEPSRNRPISQPPTLADISTALPWETNTPNALSRP